MFLNDILMLPFYLPCSALYGRLQKKHNYCIFNDVLIAAFNLGFLQLKSCVFRIVVVMWELYVHEHVHVHTGTTRVTLR